MATKGEFDKIVDARKAVVVVPDGDFDPMELDAELGDPDQLELESSSDSSSSDSDMEDTYTYQELESLRKQISKPPKRRSRPKTTEQKQQNAARSKKRLADIMKYKGMLPERIRVQVKHIKALQEIKDTLSGLLKAEQDDHTKRMIQAILTQISTDHTRIKLQEDIKLRL